MSRLAIHGVHTMGRYNYMVLCSKAIRNSNLLVMIMVPQGILLVMLTSMQNLRVVIHHLTPLEKKNLSSVHND